MVEKYFEISAHDREMVKGRLKEALQNRPGVLFAYLHGSFIKGRFRDIDVALYLNNVPPSPLDLELRLESELSEAVNRYPLDVRILNGSPLSFRYNVIKNGHPIIVNDEDARTDFEESAILNYLDFAPFRKVYLKEALGLGV